MLHLPLPTVLSSTSVILPSPATVHTVPFQFISIVHKPTSQVSFHQSSSPHIYPFHFHSHPHQNHHLHHHLIYLHILSFHLQNLHRQKKPLAHVLSRPTALTLLKKVSLNFLSVFAPFFICILYLHNKSLKICIH